VSVTNLGNLDITKNGGTTSPVEPGSLPGILPLLPKGAWDPDKFKIRYQKLDLDQPGDVTELESIETRAIRNRGVYVISKKDFVFMDRIFMLICYMEEDQEAKKPEAKK
jgi:hypothetical protein